MVMRLQIKFLHELDFYLVFVIVEIPDKELLIEGGLKSKTTSALLQTGC